MGCPYENTYFVFIAKRCDVQCNSKSNHFFVGIIEEDIIYHSVSMHASRHHENTEIGTWEPAVKFSMFTLWQGGAGAV